MDKQIKNYVLRELRNKSLISCSIMQTYHNIMNLPNIKRTKVVICY